MRQFLSFGFLAWLGATVAFRLAGHYLLDPASPLIVGALYVAVVPAMSGLALALYRWNGVTGAKRLEAAVALVLPGMFLDTVAIAFFGSVFPNMVPGAAKHFGGMLLLAYATVLVTGFVRRW
ncbi:hypothetical protein GJR96_16785 [Haloferax sp. MBLA0076]|uniref:Uncharacterized protein n=1 Tax=Haloferax litoreum TaxID=2666140 RepID=A0A6A8GM14_9EURY|nr:hypothetical protein Hfx1148_16730 [Haloferax sp. CBA1148]MRX23602.1 hypothetical protein [Haloferax litoreum]